MANLLFRNQSVANYHQTQIIYPHENNNKIRSAVEMRKKIQNYSFLVHDNIGKGYSSVVYKGANDLNGTQLFI